MVMPESFQHILRVMNTNLKGERKIMFSLTAIKGVGRRYANLCCKMAEINLDKRAGELVRLFQKTKFFSDLHTCGIMFECSLHPVYDTCMLPQHLCTRNCPPYLDGHGSRTIVFRLSSPGRKQRPMRAHLKNIS